MAHHLADELAVRDRELVSVMVQILASEMSFEDTKELFPEALEAAGIYPSVAATAASLGGPPVLAVPGMGAEEEKERAQRPKWHATYLFGMARRLQRSVDDAFGLAAPDDADELLRVALRIEGPHLLRHIASGQSRMAEARTTDAWRRG
jgi:hypothetical protein